MKGSVLYPLLLLFALLGIVLMTQWHSFAALQSSTFLLHGRKAREISDNRAIEALSSAHASGDQAVSCLDGEAAVGEIKLARKLCLRRNLLSDLEGTTGILEGPLLGKKFPQFDFDSIFTDFTRCSMRAPRIIAAPAFPLSLGSVGTAASCLAIGTSKHLAYRENIRLLGDSSIAAVTRTLATLGFLEAHGSLTLGADLLLVAAGDISLGSLAAGAFEVEMTVISATGMVMIQSIDPRIRIRVIAWQGAFLPPHRTHRDETLMPPLLKNQVLGLSSD